MSHTPGPWTIKEDSYRNGFRIRGADNEFVALVAHKTDAVLIEAAPKLLEALRGIVNDFGHSRPSCDCRICSARAVLARVDAGLQGTEK